MEPDEPKATYQMTQRDRDLAELFAQHTTARILDALQDEETADRIFTKWATRAQQMVGRVVIRTVFYIIGVSLLIASIKAGAIDRIVEVFTIRGPGK